jgi:uncharacterized membrane protein YeiH
MSQYAGGAPSCHPSLLVTRSAPFENSTPESVPPGAITDWHYLGVSLVAGLLTFYFPAAIRQRWNPVLLFDAAGLALFAVSGAHKALVYGLNPIMAILLGMLTGIGGGMARDVLLAEIPTVLRAELYAMAALVGAAVVVIGSMLQLASSAATLVGAALCSGLRVLALRHGWQLPVAGTDRRRAPSTDTVDNP